MYPRPMGDYSLLSELVSSGKINRIIVALPDRRKRLPIGLLLQLKLSGVKIEEGEGFYERITGKVPLDHLKPSWLIFSDGFRIPKYTRVIKRIADVVFATTGLLFALPFFIIVPLLIRLDSQGKAIFRQTRVGQNDRHFVLYKFRSMVSNAESDGPVWAGEKDKRVTRVGAVLRKLRIDELPQLINVLKGDMSFVGPRPERPFFISRLEKKIPYYKLRHVVKPGITGWAQIKYPYGASVKDATEKLEYELYYLKNISLLFDITIVLSTIKIVLFGRGAR